MGYDLNRRPGTFVLSRARLHTRRTFIAFGAGMALLAGVLYAAFGLASSLLAVVAVAVLYGTSRAFATRAELSRRWTIGARAEQAVGSALNELRQDGYVVMHDLPQAGEGNIDHLVSGPSGVYLVETKARWYPPEAPRKASRQAARLRDALGTWVTPVICIADRDATPRRHGRAWVVPLQHLTNWIRQQKNSRADSERLARFADGLGND